MTERPPSYSYQHLFYEVKIDNIETFEDNEPPIYSERFLDLNEQATSIIMSLAEKALTPRQYKIWSMVLDGQDTKDIAANLNVTPGAITKSLGGDYKNGIRHGGIYAAMRKAILSNEELRKILQQMNEELKNDD